MTPQQTAREVADKLAGPEYVTITFCMYPDPELTLMAALRATVQEVGKGLEQAAVTRALKWVETFVPSYSTQEEIDPQKQFLQLLARQQAMQAANATSPYPYYGNSPSFLGGLSGLGSITGGTP